MSQKERILRYISQYGSITQGEAFSQFGCARLASRIEELRKLGYKIVTDWEQSTNCFGEPVRYARYRFKA